jgi:hypothetical protein
MDPTELASCLYQTTQAERVSKSLSFCTQMWPRKKSSICVRLKTEVYHITIFARISLRCKLKMWLWNMGTDISPDGESEEVVIFWNIFTSFNFKKRCILEYISVLRVIMTVILNITNRSVFVLGNESVHAKQELNFTCQRVIVNSQRQRPDCTSLLS